MNSERNRLKTFDSWPIGGITVCAARVAKAGFFYTGEDHTVQCFYCGVHIDDWIYGDSVWGLHRNLNPQCGFVLDSANSGNIPLGASLDLTEVPSITGIDFKLEDNRRASFELWPSSHIVTTEDLARAGFYYLQLGDKTRCAFCDGTLSHWKLGDVPDEEHKRHFSACPFVVSMINPRLLARLPRVTAPLSATDLGSNQNLDALGVYAHCVPKNPSCGTVEMRLRTYGDWPMELVQTPHMLAEAGFYYEGVADHVRCFHCDGGLRHWDPKDDPWREHAKWFPQCTFLQIVKGQDYITQCGNDHNEDEEAVSQNKVSKPSTLARTYLVPDREVEHSMNTEAVQAALNVGLSVDRIKEAQRAQMFKTGRPFSSADALIEATLNLEETMSGSMPSNDVRLANNALTSASQSTSATEVNDTNVAGGSSSFAYCLEEENRMLREARLCKICMDSEVGIVFLPCGHFATCFVCAPNLEDCPVCRSAIKATVRTFLS